MRQVCRATQQTNTNQQWVCDDIDQGLLYEEEALSSDSIGSLSPAVSNIPGIQVSQKGIPGYQKAPSG